MSRIGRTPIAVPNGVEIQIEDSTVRVKGPKGELSRPIPQGIQLTRENGELQVTRVSEARQHKALHGLTRTLVANMVTGVTDGFTKRLEIQGVGYRAQQGQGGAVVVQVGYSHPIEFVPPAGVQFTIEAGNRIPGSGLHKKVVGGVGGRTRRVGAAGP